MNLPRRVENLQTDKGKVPVYATGVVAHPWFGYSAGDHDAWRRLYERQRRVPVRADAMGMTPDRIPKFSDLNQALRDATGWDLIRAARARVGPTMATCSALL